jgi:hypothetical protein
LADILVEIIDDLPENNQKISSKPIKVSIIAPTDILPTKIKSIKNTVDDVVQDGTLSESDTLVTNDISISNNTPIGNDIKKNDNVSEDNDNNMEMDNSTQVDNNDQLENFVNIPSVEVCDIESTDLSSRNIDTGKLHKHINPCENLITVNTHEMDIMEKCEDICTNSEISEYTQSQVSQRSINKNLDSSRLSNAEKLAMRRYNTQEKIKIYKALKLSEMRNAEQKKINTERRIRREALRNLEQYRINQEKHKKVMLIRSNSSRSRNSAI